MTESAPTPAPASRPRMAKRCFFKNALVYRLPKDFNLSSVELEEQLAKRPLTECGPLETERRGWVPSTPFGDRLVHTVNGSSHLIALGTYTKILPGSVVREEAQKQAQALAQEQGFPVGRKQMRELKDKVHAELLAKALVRTQVTRAWIDTANRWLVVEASGGPRAEKLVSTLRDSLLSFAATLLDPVQAPELAMAAWLREGDAPLRFSLDSDLEMQSIDKGKATVRYARHELNGQDILLHLNAGKMVTRLGLTWAEKISFVLNHKLELKRIAFLALDADGGDDKSESIEKQFDADVLLMVADFGELLGDLVQALGGERAVESEAAAAV